ncbi:MAG TPA: PAS domain S-box protein [Thiotrichaceae bacterium]|nr:PAS domain S-box protein [Thiotrichaceae bacterium]
MNNNMNINSKLLIGLVILMVICLFAIFQIYTASNFVTQLHRHPFMVSNAVRDINLNILKMHHSMGEVALFQNQADFNSVVNTINLHEQQVYQQIALINERFLGDKQQVEQLKQLFIEWQPIRQEIIGLIKADQREEAAVLFEAHAHAHVVRLEKAMRYLVVFSNQKADEFIKHAHNQFQFSYFWDLIVILVLIIIMARLIKQVKKAFHQSEERYRAIVEGQTELVCRFLPDTTLTFVNPAYCRYFCVQEQNILGQPFLSLIPEEAHKVILEHLQWLFNNPQLISKTLEHPVIAKHGKITWQRWTDRVILDRDGKVIEFQSVGIDITERKQMEEKLTQTTEQLSLLLEHLPIIPYTAKAADDFGATYINQSVTAITGYVPEDFTANPSFWTDHLHPEDKSAVFENMNKLVEQGTQEMEYRWQIADGSYKWFSDIARLVKKSDNSHYIVGTWHDITKRKLIKKALDESNKRYRNIIEVANEGIWFIDANNITTFVNQNMAKMLGYTEAEMLGKSLFMFMDDKWHQQADRNVDRRREGISEQHDFKFQRKDGTALWAILNTRPLFEKTGQYTGTFAMVTDITERKKMEDALREQREFLRLIIDNIPQYIFWKDMNCVYLGCNNRFAQFVNLKNPEEIVGKTDFDLLWQAQAESICRIERRLMETDTPEYHVIKQNANGSVLWTETNKMPLHDVNGKVVGILGTMADITERQTAEEKRHEIEARLAETQQIARLGHWKWAILTGMMTWSEEVFKHFGLPYIPPHEISFKTFIKAVHLHDRRNVYRWIDQTLYQNKASEIEYRIVRPDKTIRYLQSFAKTIRNSAGKLSHVLGTSQDITERKQAELDLQHSQKALEQTNVELQRFKTTLDMTLDCVFMTEAKRYQFFYTNQGATKLLGYTQQELQQMTLLDIVELNIVHTQLLKEAFNPSQAGLTFESLFQHKNTGLIPVEIFAQFIQLEDNSQHFLIIARDITARQKVQAQLQQAKEAAESANRAKSTFLANMSHEVRTPLNGILGYTQLLKRDDTLSTQHKEAIDVIHRSGEYLLTLINDILDISKIEANRVELYQTDFDLNDFLKSFVDLFRMRSQEKGIDFIYQALTPLPHIIYADEKRLRQIIINLLSNAIKFTNVGGVTLKVGVIESIEEERESIQGESEKAALHQTRIRFQVEDTGIGITQTALSKIFIPFQQVGERKYQSAGTGLGLSITQKLVDLMGGQLQVESTLEQGSTFGIELDLATVSPRQIVDKPLPKKSQMISFEGPPLKILVVEDNQDNRLVLTHLLTALDFEVKEAKNGQDAINQTHEWRPDLIFMDIVMPVIDGYEATRQIKRIPELQKTIIVAVSASAFKSHQQESQEAGCDDFIAKPIHTETLLNCLQKHLKFKVIESESKTTKDTLQESEEVWLQEPSVEQATTLFNLTLRGDLDGILEYVNKLEQNEPQLKPFIDQIKAFAKELKIKRIRQIVQQYM